MKIIIGEKTVTIVLLTFFYFFTIFAPPLISGVHLDYVALLFMLFYILYYLSTRNMVMHIRRKSLKFLYGFIPFLIFVLLCMIFRVAFSNTLQESTAYILNFRHVFVSFLFVVLSYGFLTCFLDKHKKMLKNDLLRVLVFVAILQSFCIIVSYFHEGIQSLFVGLVLKNSEAEIMQEAINKNLFRAYGFSNYYFDALAYVLAGLSILFFAEGLYSKNTFMLFVAVFVSLSSTLTARTGVVLSVVGFLIVSVYYFRNRVKISLKAIIKGLVVFFIIICLCYGFYESMSAERKASIEYAVLVTQKLVINQEIEGIYWHILLSDVVFPDNLLFGLNARPESMGFYDSFGHGIDNGYIQIIWRFGIIGFFLLLFGYIYFFRRVYKNSNDLCTKSIIVAFSVCLALYYVKIYALNKHGANIIYCGMPLIFFYYEHYRYSLHNNDPTVLRKKT